jgi:hypothetical protein
MSGIEQKLLTGIGTGVYMCVYILTVELGNREGKLTKLHYINDDICLLINYYLFYVCISIH